MARSHLLKELDELLSLEFISEEQHEDIQCYLLNKKSNPLTTIPILPLIGVILICSGLIAIAASNWVHFPMTLKLFVAFIPLVLVSVAFYRIKDTASQTKIECLAIAIGLLELLAFGIVANVYQTPVSTEYLMQLVIASLIPLVYCYQTYWLAAMLLTGVLYGADSNYLLLSLMGLVAFVPFTISRIHRDEPIRLLTLLHIAAVCRFISLITTSEIPFLILFALLTLATLFYREEYFLHLIHSVHMLSLFGLSMESGVLAHITDFFPVIAVLYMTLATFMLYYAKIQYDKEEFSFDTCKKYVSYSITLFMAVIPFKLLTILIILAFLSYDTVSFYKEGDLKQYNKKSALLTVFILFQMACLDFPFMMKGVLFIITGCGFLFISKQVSTQLQGGENHE